MGSSEFFYDVDRKANFVKIEAVGYKRDKMDDFAKEIELTRENEKLMQFLVERAKQTKTIGLEEVKAQLGLD